MASCSRPSRNSTALGSDFPTIRVTGRIAPTWSSGSGSSGTNADVARRDTGRDMQEKYKETSRGGLATHVVHVPVNVIEC